MWVGLFGQVLIEFARRPTQILARRQNPDLARWRGRSITSGSAHDAPGPGFASWRPQAAYLDGPCRRSSAPSHICCIGERALFDLARVPGILRTIIIRRTNARIEPRFSFDVARPDSAWRQWRSL